MSLRMRVDCYVFLCIATLSVMGISGCYKSPDLTGYHKAKQGVGRPEDPQEKMTSEKEAEVSAEVASTDDAQAESRPADTEIDVNGEEPNPVSALVPVNVVDGGNIRALMSVPSTPIESTSRTAVTDVAPAAANPSKVDPEQPRKIEILIKEKQFRPDKQTRALRVSFDDLDLLKVLNMEPVVENAVELMPDWLRGLSGQKIRLRGYMYPTFDTEGIEHFVLARDNQICCFGRDPKIYDLVQVDMKAGKSTYYISPTRAFDVVGTFKIEMHSEGGKQMGLYVIGDAEVIDR